MLIVRMGWSGWILYVLEDRDGRIADGLDVRVAQMVKRMPPMQETHVQSLDQEDLWRRKWQPTPVFLPGKSHGQRSLAGYCPWGCKESDTAEHATMFLVWIALFLQVPDPPLLEHNHSCNDSALSPAQKWGGKEISPVEHMLCVYEHQLIIHNIRQMRWPKCRGKGTWLGSHTQGTVGTPVTITQSHLFPPPYLWRDLL